MQCFGSQPANPADDRSPPLFSQREGDPRCDDGGEHDHEYQSELVGNGRAEVKFE